MDMRDMRTFIVRGRSSSHLSRPHYGGHLTYCIRDGSHYVGVTNVKVLYSPLLHVTISIILKLVVCILLRVLGQVQGLRLKQHWFEYFIQYRYMLVIRPKHVAVLNKIFKPVLR
jgi:hypothetical protein